MKNKKAAINPKMDDDKCFRYAAMIALNHEEIKKYPQRILTIKHFRNNYKWDGIKYPSQIDDWKTFEKNNSTIALNVFCIKEVEICPVYISKINSDCEKETILLMISNKENNAGIILQLENYLY